jgi:hypothetical protein
MSWSKNNNAHKTLWALITYFHKESLEGQPFVKFADGGEWDIGRVIKVAGNASPEMVKNNAGAMATKLDEFFIGVFKAKYEKVSDTVDENSARGTGIAAMTNALAQTNKKLKTVGDIVDEHYVFKGEVE